MLKEGWSCTVFNCCSILASAASGLAARGNLSSQKNIVSTAGNIKNQQTSLFLCLRYMLCYSPCSENELLPERERGRLIGAEVKVHCVTQQLHSLLTSSAITPTYTLPLHVLYIGSDLFFKRINFFFLQQSVQVLLRMGEGQRIDLEKYL